MDINSQRRLFVHHFLRGQERQMSLLFGRLIPYCLLYSMWNFGAPALGRALQSISELRITSVVDAVGTLPRYLLAGSSLPVSVSV